MIHIEATENVPPTLPNKKRSEAMYVCAGILRYGRSKSTEIKIDDGPAEHLISCIQMMTGIIGGEVWLDANRNMFGELLHEKVKNIETAEL